MKDGIEVGVLVSRCSDCDKLIKGTEIYNMFNWREYVGVLGFDKRTEEILVSEEQLMRIIQIVNPHQPSRPIRLVSTKEMLGGVRDE